MTFSTGASPLMNHWAAVTTVAPALDVCMTNTVTPGAAITAIATTINQAVAPWHT